MPPRATPPHHFLSGAGFYTGESGDTGAAGPSEAGGCARRAEGSAGDRPERTPRVTSPPRPAPHPSGVTRAPLGYFQLHPCHRFLRVPARSSPAAAAWVLQGCSCSRWFGMLQALPLRLLSSPSGLALGLGRAWGRAGGVWWLSGGCWLSPVSPCAVWSGAEGACSRRAPAVGQTTLLGSFPNGAPGQLRFGMPGPCWPLPAFRVSPPSH